MTDAPDDSAIRAHCEAGRFDEAAAATLQLYGPGVLGFIAAIVRDEDVAGDVFGQFTEDVLKGIGSFKWPGAFRAWVYTVARNATRRYFRSPDIKRQQRAATQEILRIEQRVRSTLPAYMRSSVKGRFAMLREELDPDDQTLLILRVDRGMSWREIAEVMAGDGDGEAEIKTRTASLRKKFQRLKEALKRRAAETGLFGK